MIGSSPPDYQILVHSHLRWDWVWQRPQQFLSRLSRRHPVLFVEGPQLRDDLRESYYELHTAPGNPAVTVLQIFLPAERFHDGGWVDSERHRLVQQALSGELRGQFTSPIQWFYDPMAFTAHGGKHGELLAVYDCMDELSQFKFAPPELGKRERQLLFHASLVFAGGRKIWQSKSRFNTHTHFFGCGVDNADFGSARLESTAIPAELTDLNGPILGYFGVVDERLDYDLIARLADADPNWHVVMVGPACKIDPASFPQRPNLHWLGGKSYAELPGYCKAFDVCLMPFALNEATEFINPTKALEYMATGTPVVSTAVPDVVSNFSSVAHIGSPDGFIRYCQVQSRQPDQAAVDRGLDLARENSWDDIVARMERHIDQAVARRLTALTPVQNPALLSSTGMAQNKSRDWAPRKREDVFDSV